MKVSFLSKSGDLIYALPAVKALSREHGKIRLVLSCLSFPIIPLIWEQPYIEDVDMIFSEIRVKDEVYEGVDWQVLTPDEGINLSIGPRWKEYGYKIPWTEMYAKIAGVELTPSDKFALPTLWNHRQWYYGHELKTVDRTFPPPETIILAPESETFEAAPLKYYIEIAEALYPYKCILIGLNRDDLSWPENVTDLRGQTTLVSAAHIIAEARAFVGSMSSPFHLARHAGTPSFAFQRHYAPQSLPIDTPYKFYAPELWEKVVVEIRKIIQDETVTLWNQETLEATWNP